MINLEPYFDKLNNYEINRLVEVSIKNNQIYNEGMCQTKFLPKFIEKHRDKIDDDKLKKLSQKIGYEIIGVNSMDKWADYCISHVRYNHPKTHIEQVKVREDLGNSLGKPSTWKRKDVLDSLENHETFCTITLGTDDKWNHGDKVEIVTINGINYIKTSKDSAEKDNLGKLPIF
jgi:hypothetical protein